MYDQVFMQAGQSTKNLFYDTNAVSFREASALSEQAFQIAG